MNHPGEIADLAQHCPAHRGAGEQRPARAPEIHATPCRPWPKKTAASGHVCPWMAWPCFRRDDAFTPCGKAWPRGHGAHLWPLAWADVRSTQAQWQRQPLAGADRHAARPAAHRLDIAGRHNVRNALAATACALAAGVPLAAIAQGLQAFTPSRPARGRWPCPGQGRTLTLVDDTYNANPDSVQAADCRAGRAARAAPAGAGRYGRGGDQGPAFHAEVGPVPSRRD